MRCLCGCERRLSRGQTKTNLLAGEVALELILWDKARSLRSPVAAAEIEALLDEGAPLYQELLARLHGSGEPGEEELAPTRAWLERSRAARRRIGEQLPTVPKKKAKLSSGDAARVDRVHPERSFSGEPATASASRPASAAALEALLGAALEDVRSGRVAEAEEALRRFLAERS